MAVCSLPLGYKIGPSLIDWGQHFASGFAWGKSYLRVRVSVGARSWLRWYGLVALSWCPLSSQWATFCRLQACVMWGMCNWSVSENGISFWNDLQLKYWVPSFIGTIFEKEFFLCSTQISSLAPPSAHPVHFLLAIYFFFNFFYMN